MKAILVIDVDEDMIGEVDYTVLNKAEMVNGRTELRPLPKWKINRCTAFEDGAIVDDYEVFDWVKELIE